MEQNTRQRQSERYELLSDFVLLSSKTPDLDNLQENLIDVAKHVLDFDRVTLALLEEDSQTFQIQTLFDNNQMFLIKPGPRFPFQRATLAL